MTGLHYLSTAVSPENTFNEHKVCFFKMFFLQTVAKASPEMIDRDENLMPEGSTDEMPEGSSGAAEVVPRRRKRRRGELEILASNSPVKGGGGTRSRSRSGLLTSMTPRETSAQRQRNLPANLGERVVSSPTKRRPGAAGEAHWRHDDERLNASVQSAITALSILGPKLSKADMVKILSKDEDFSNVKTILEEFFESQPHVEYILNAKFWCDLQWVEQYWNDVKREVRELCDYTLPQLKKQFPKSLSSVSMI
jgi:hypothetical protein